MLTFDEFCEQWEVTSPERKSLWMYLVTMRMTRMLDLYQRSCSAETSTGE